MVRPELFLLQPGLGVNPGGHGFGIGQRDFLHVAVGQVTSRLDWQRTVNGHHDHERIPQTIFARAHINQIFLNQAIHFGFVGGKENIGGRAFLNLPGERAGRAEVENDFVTGFSPVDGGDLLERIRQAHGGEHSDLSGVRAGHPQQNETDHQN